MKKLINKTKTPLPLRWGFSIGGEEMTVQEAYHRLEESFEQFQGEEEWKEYLDFSARFHSYSLNNTAMIYLQKPRAQFLKGYKAWQKIGRQVKKGEKAIQIFAPMSRKMETKAGKEVYRLSGFRLISVFDLSQTNGDDDKLPSMIKGLQTDVDYSEVLDTILQKIDVPVSFDDLSYELHGFYEIKENAITLNSRNSPVHTLKTLFHELAHHYHMTAIKDRRAKFSYEQEEFVAESSAYLVCATLGIDSGDYSIPYLKAWLNDFKAFQEMRRDIEKTTKKILKLIKREEVESCTSTTTEHL